MAGQGINGWTQEDLNKATCAAPGCTQKHHHGPLTLGGRCHPAKPLVVRYHWGGVVEIRCKICNKHCCNVLVAPEQRAVLDEMVVNCGDPACREPPENHSRILRGCVDHPTAGAYAAYYDGQLTVACGKCKCQVDTYHVKHEAAQA